MPPSGAPPVLNEEKLHLGNKNGNLTHRTFRRAQLSPLPQTVDTVPTLTPSPPSSASWVTSPETITSPMSASMFFVSAVEPFVEKPTDAIANSAPVSCWGEQPPDLVTAASCMESFMDLKQYCNTSVFTGQPEGELNTPDVEFAKEPNFDIPSRTVPENDIDYSPSWGVSEPLGFSDNYDIWQREKEPEEANITGEINTINSDNNNNNNDIRYSNNNNNNMRLEYRDSEPTQVQFGQQPIMIGDVPTPLYAKGEFLSPETYTNSAADSEIYLIVDREEVVPPVAEEVVVKNESTMSPLCYIKTEESQHTEHNNLNSRKVAAARRRRNLKVELPPPTLRLPVQITPVSATGDLFQSVPQDFDLMKFLLEDGIPEGVPDPLMTLKSDGRVPEIKSSQNSPTLKRKTCEGEVAGFVKNSTGCQNVGVKRGKQDRTQLQDAALQQDTIDKYDTGPQTVATKPHKANKEPEKLQLVIRKTNSPNGHDSPSYTVIQRPQRAASKRVLQAIKEELQDDEDEEEVFDDTDEDEYEPVSDEGRSTASRKRSAARKPRKEKSHYEPPRQRRRTTSVSSTDEVPACLRYRELRDKNNEASRRSRENRKLREAEMQEQRERLERENARLRVRAEELERLVDALRKALVAAVSSSASKRGSTGTED